MKLNQTKTELKFVSWLSKTKEKQKGVHVLVNKVVINNLWEEKCMTKYYL